jgi:glycosyltransferase involved in cell wall biosynthesis
MAIISEYEANARVRRQAEALAARGDDVTVLALHAPGRPRTELIDGVRVVHSRTRKYRGDSARSYVSLYGGFFVRAAAWFSRQPRRFDVVQTHTMPEAVIFAATVQKALRVPLLLDVHDLTERLFASKFREHGAMMTAVRANTKASLRFADEVLTVHEPYAQILRELTRRRISIVMNCPDERLFPMRPHRPRSLDDDVVFSYHGLIAPRHGLVNAVEALAELRRDVPGARLQVLGSGDGLSGLRARVAELDQGDAVTLPTEIRPVSEIADQLEKVHIGLVPSQLDPWTNEVLPTKLLEYAALGIPVITFRNPVIERYFPEDSVLYVDPASPQNLLAAMRALVADPARAQRQADRASQIVARISWSQQKLAYFEVIDRMARRRLRRADPSRSPAHAHVPQPRRKAEPREAHPGIAASEYNS